MSERLIDQSHQDLDLVRGSAAVCVMLDDDLDAALRTLDSIVELAASELGAPCLLVSALAATVEATLDALDARRPRTTVRGLVAPNGLADAVRATNPADLVLLRAGTRVHREALRRLQAAALADAANAAATPLFHGNADAARAIAADSLELRPRQATIGPDCAYLRRSALDRACPELGACSPAEYLDELAVKCLALGMSPVAADDVAIETDERPPSTASPASTAGKLERALAAEAGGALQRARKRGALSLGGLSVTVDARSLTAGAVGGTQTYVLGLIRALAPLPSLSLRVLVPPDLSDSAAAIFATIPQIELLSVEQATSVEPSDVAHRPQQAFSMEDVALLKLLGDRVVLTHQDLIGYHNYSYHTDSAAWQRYRQTTRLALAAADQVIFFTRHARADALAEQLLGRQRAHVVGIGADQPELAREPPLAPSNPALADPFLLCLGADYAHKNRPFAIELLAELHKLGWSGRLVLAGPHVAHGSSSAEEQQLLDADAELAASVVDLGPIAEPTKQWLLANARALVYPTVYEGFGLLPLEAARNRTPCVFAAQTSLAELASEAATIVPWDAAASAAAVAPLLEHGREREEHLTALDRARMPAWSEVAAQLLSVYETAASGPPAPAAAWQELDRERYLELSRELRYHRDLAKDLQDRFARVSYGLPLIDDDGMLTRQQQRGLMRVASRRAPSRLVLPWLGLLGRPASPKRER